jgi:S-adenosylmethionine hydrolase
MKGVILGICPEARLVDLSHEVSPHDVLEGQLVLEGATRFFPAGSVHLAVVDPGVGSARRPLLVSAGGHCFVGPDNGLFTFALGAGDWSAVLVEARDLRLREVSATFHGRDIFAPAAAHLARGVPLHRFGPPVTDPVRLALPAARVEGDVLAGEVIGVDRFGNLITSVTSGLLARFAGTRAIVVEIGGRSLGPPLEAYAEAGQGTPAAIIGSSGRLEIFVKEASAAAALGARRATAVRVRVC